MVKNTFCLLIACFVMVSACTFSDNTGKVINESNEYGGKTIVFTLSSTDEYYRKGVSRSIQYYDRKEKLVRKEVLYTDESARKDGYIKSIAYYDSNERQVKREIFPTEESARMDGIAMTIRHYDRNEKMIEEEFIHTAEFAGRSGVSKGIVYYDNNERQVKTEHYGKDGSLLKNNINLVPFLLN